MRLAPASRFGRDRAEACAPGHKDSSDKKVLVLTACPGSALFREVDSARRELVTSALTLLEVLVVPYRSGDHLLAERYEALLTQSRGVRVAEISRDHLRAAAQLRAATGVKTPDSLQLVAALAAGCATFLTNDRDLPTIRGLRILQLASYGA